MGNLSEEGALELLKSEALREDVTQTQSALQLLESLRLAEAQALTLREELSSLAHSQMNNNIDAIGADLSLLSGTIGTKAAKGAAIASPDATDLATAITLLNEIKAVVSAMNA